RQARKGADGSERGRRGRHREVRGLAAGNGTAHRRGPPAGHRARGMKRQLAALYGNVLAGARLALFMRVRPFDYHASPVDYAWLLAFNFCMWVAVALLRSG